MIPDGKLDVFSAFSGIGAFELALQSIMPDKLGKVYYSEIDKYTLACYQKHFPEHINFGDVEKLDIPSLPDFDLLVGGFPCIDLSVAKKNREGLKGKKSRLFYTLVEILRIKKPKYFVFENVKSMPQEDKELISRFCFGCEGEEWEKLEGDQLLLSMILPQ